MRVHTQALFAWRYVFAYIALVAGFFGSRVYGAITTAETGLPQTARNAGLREDVYVPQYVGIVINTLLGIIGVVFLLIIVYAGIQWMLAQGEETKISHARTMIFQAIIGLILVFAAYAITSFVVSSLVTQTIK